MKWRWLNHLYARITGYFWAPCSRCGRLFGGHEASNEARLTAYGWRVVCRDCASAQRMENLKLAQILPRDPLL